MLENGILSLSLIEANVGSATVALDEARNQLIDELSQTPTQQSLEQLELNLNMLILSQRFSEGEVLEKLVNKLPKYVPEGVNLQYKGSHFTAGNLWSDYYSKLNQLKQGQNDITINDVEKAKSEALSLRSKMGRLQGQVFESLLQGLIPLMQQNNTEITEKVVDDFIKMMEQPDYNPETIGTQHDKTISVQVGPKTIKIHSQGKVDVQLEAPFLGEDDNFGLAISAKSYASLRDISLLSGANLFGLVNELPVSMMIKDMILSSTTKSSVDQPGSAPYEILERAKFFFGVQALMGTGRNGSPLANTLIINTRNRDKHPITVLSIPEFLKYMNESEDLFRHGFIVTLKRNPPVGTPQDDWDKLIDEINSIKVNIHMAKSMLTMSALSQYKRFLGI